MGGIPEQRFVMWSRSVRVVKRLTGSGRAAPRLRPASAEPRGLGPFLSLSNLRFSARTRPMPIRRPRIGIYLRVYLRIYPVPCTSPAGGSDDALRPCGPVAPSGGGRVEDFARVPSGGEHHSDSSVRTREQILKSLNFF